MASRRELPYWEYTGFSYLQAQTAQKQAELGPDYCVADPSDAIELETQIKSMPDMANEMSHGHHKPPEATRSHRKCLRCKWSINV